MLLKITGQFGSVPLREESEKKPKKNYCTWAPKWDKKNPVTFQRHSRPLPFFNI